jgi:hypothetical protein
MADPPKTFRELVEAESPPWLLGELSGAFEGVILGLMADTIAEAMGAAVRMPWLLEPLSPPDVLPFIGSERRLPRYPGETEAQYRARLHGAWEAYEFAGDESSILGQLAKAGYPGAQIYDPWNMAFLPLGYWSQFIVWFPIGTHPVTDAGAVWGSFNWGDGTVYGPGGLTVAIATTLRRIIKKWKPVEWICRGIMFQISGWAWGDGSTYGQGGLQWGGNVVVMGA